MTKDQKKTIKEKIMNYLYLDQPTDKEREETAEIILDIFRQALQRFIEETNKGYLIEAGDETGKASHEYLEGYNQALKELNQKQQQWLKENL